MVMLKKLMILFAASSLLLTSGCITINLERSPSKFPPTPKLLDYTKDPVLAYSEANDTYIITSEYMQNSLQNDIFLKQILEWKERNDIR